MPLCKLYEYCHMPAEDNDIYCLFHSRRKEVKYDFYDKLDKYIDRRHYIFNFFIFPPSYRFENIDINYLKFYDCHFNGNLYLQNITVYNDFVFDNCVVQGTVNINNITFDEANTSASFAHSIFEHDIQIVDVKFPGKVSIERCNIQKKLTINSTNNDTNIMLKGVNFYLGKNIMGHDARIHFTNTNMETVNFSCESLQSSFFENVSWPKMNNMAVVCQDKKWENASLGNPQGMRQDWDELYEIYTKIRRSYETSGQKIIAGDFFFRENIALIRSNKISKIKKFYHLYPYWLLSGFGEKLIYPIFWLIFINFVGSYLILAFGDCSDGNTQLNLRNMESWCKITDYVSQKIFTGSTAVLSCSKIGSWIAKVVTWLSTIPLAMLCLAIIHKIKR